MASQEESTDGFALPLAPDPKKIKLPIPGKCIIYQTEKPSNNLSKGKDLSVHTLLKSAHIRQDKVFKRIYQEDLSSIEVYWHANC